MPCLLAAALGTALVLMPNHAAGDLTVDDITAYGHVQVIRQEATGDPPSDGLVVHYTCTADNSSTVADESNSANSHDGSVAGATWVPNGITGGAYELDGNNDYITIADHADLNFTANEDFTFAVWVKADTAPSYQPQIAYKYDTGTSKGYLICINHVGKLRFTIYGTVDVTAVDTATIETGVWYHLAAVRDYGSNIRLYVNGALVAETSESVGTLHSTKALRLGNGHYGSQYFDGIIDEFRVYTRALSAEEISNIYLGTIPLDDNDGLLSTHTIEQTASGATNSFAGPVELNGGAMYVKPLGDVEMGIYQSQP